MNDLIPKARGGPTVRDSPLDEPAGPVKVARQLRELFREAFDNLGGSEFLVEFALKSDANARVFVQAISKLLPASANPNEKQEKIIIDIPWLTKDRLAYQRLEKGPLDKDVVDILPKPRED